MNGQIPKDIQRWEETRKRGKWNFILVNGVLAWGVPMFAIMTFFVNKRPDKPLTLGMLAVSAVIWACGGFCFGLAMWAFSERRYQKYLAAQNQSPSDKNA